MKLLLLYFGTILMTACFTGGWADTVNESARDIPVAYDVDVVVVGGSTGAVAAAVAAEQEGAKVFLAAPRPYLGEDVCATLRLWLEPGEEPVSPLAKAIFTPPRPALSIGKSVPFTYQADLPSAAPHKDTDPPEKLADGKANTAFKDSVEFKGDVTLLLDLGQDTRFGMAHVLAFQRPNDIELQDVVVSLSKDGKTWGAAVTLNNDKLGQGEFINEPLHLAAPLTGSARYVKLVAHKTPDVQRILLGEIIVEPERTGNPSPPDTSRIPPMPMQVKRTLDEALLKAGVQFLYGCYPTDVLWSKDGKPAGIVMANRSGRQAVKAKIIIDATAHASVARMAGAKFREALPGVTEFRRVVVGGRPPESPGINVRKLPAPIQIEQGGWSDHAYRDAYEYTLSLPLKDASFASYAEAEQRARDLTWSPGQLLASDMLFEVPPTSIQGKKYGDFGAFKPDGIERIDILSGCADVSREEAARLLRPVSLVEMGARIGKAAGVEAKALPKSDVAPLKSSRPVAGDKRDLREPLAGVRRAQAELRKVHSDARSLPVLATYDVIVVGGGTGGAPAGIAAARQGAKTLVIEYLDGLGGVGTLGLIGTYYHGYRGGFTKEIDEGVAAMGGSPRPVSASWNVEHKMEWYRRELRKAGADIWFGALACGALVEGNCVKGVAVATPDGRGVVLAKVVIDATGNADIAAAAGAECMTTGAAHVAVQGTGMPPRKPGEHYTNTDYTITDDADVVDAWRTYVAGRNKYKVAFDLGQLIDSRERRRIVGDFVISPLEVWNHRTYPDTVGQSRSDFDTHGFTVHSMFALQAPDHKEVTAYTPFRALLPEGLEGILVTGLGVSAHRDAMPILRMQPDIQNQGYAAGIAAAMAAKSGSGLRQIDIKALQQQLVEKGNLPASVLSGHDSYPMSQESLQAAVADVVPDYNGVAVLLAQPDDAVPLLKRAYKDATQEDAKRVYAHILGIMGKPDGADTLVEAVGKMPWDQGWSFTGMGQYGGSLSRLDSLLIALARTQDARALDTILAKASTLTPDSEFSHFRGVAIALETLRRPEAAQTLAGLLNKPGMTGNAETDIETAKRAAEAANPNLDRDHSIRELILARALFRCGDHEGLGEKILKTYANDLRGHLAQHARAILEEHTKPTAKKAFQDLDVER